MRTFRVVTPVGDDQYIPADAMRVSGGGALVFEYKDGLNTMEVLIAFAPGEWLLGDTTPDVADAVPQKAKKAKASRKAAKKASKG